MLKLYKLPYCDKCNKTHIVERHKQSCLKNLGVDNPSKLDSIKEKINNTFQKKYGDHPKRTSEVHEKWVATCLEKYGGHPNQNREVQAKSEYKGCNYKDFRLPSGKIVKVQGYEPLALEFLLKSVSENDIVIGKASVPTIEYSIGQKKHVYFPDIFLPAEHKLIEVKSEWSLTKLGTHVEEKALASVLSGYAYEIWIYDGLKKFSRKIVYAFDGSKEIIPA